MIDSIRIGASKVAFLLAAYLAPRYMRPFLRAFTKSIEGVADQVEDGRTGGVMTAAWSIDDNGKMLSGYMEDQAHRVMAEVRHEWTTGRQS